jgi:hypothetical protein
MYYMHILLIYCMCYLYSVLITVTEGTVRIRVRIGPLHPLTSRKRRLNGAVLRMRLQKLRPFVTAGVAQ